MEDVVLVLELLTVLRVLQQLQSEQAPVVEVEVD